MLKKTKLAGFPTFEALPKASHTRKSQGPIMWQDHVPRQYRAGSQVRLNEREAFGEPINQLAKLTCFLEVMKIRGHALLQRTTARL